MKALLLESYNSTKKITGVNPSLPGKQFQSDILGNDRNFATYKTALSEGICAADQKAFSMLCENTRQMLLENSMYGLNPYETLALPLLRVFFPKTIAKELVTTIPMDKPEIVRGFIRATFKKFGDSNSYAAPSLTDISGGPSIGSGIPVQSIVACPGSTDLLAIAGLTQDVAHVEKTFKIVRIFDAAAGGGNATSIDLMPTVDGEFAASVTINGSSDVLTGRINYLTGVVDLASTNNVVKSVAITAQVSMEENTISPRVSFSIDKMRLIAKDRQISTEWTVQFEQDLKALFNSSVQAELVSVIGQQIVLDIDREIVNSLIYTAQNLAGAGHVDSFYKTPPATFTWGPKMWIENVLPKLSQLSAQIYADTNIAAGNTLACNPLDAAMFESLQEFRYTGSSTEDGDLGYQAASISGKWKVLVSSVVPKGKILCGYRPQEDIRACFIFSPYVPAVLTPYPLGNTPSLTVLSRYGSQLIRPAGFSVLNVYDGAQP